jgi:hypothetical protein
MNNNNNFLMDEKNCFSKKKIEERINKNLIDDIFNINLSNKNCKRTCSYFEDKNNDFFIENETFFNKTKRYVNRIKKIFNYKNNYNSIMNGLNNNFNSNYKKNLSFKRSHSSPFYLLKTIYVNKSTINNWSNIKYHGKLSNNYIERKGNKGLRDFNSRSQNNIFNKYKKVKTNVFPANPFDSLEL